METVSPTETCMSSARVLLSTTWPSSGWVWPEDAFRSGASFELGSRAMAAAAVVPARDVVVLASWVSAPLRALVWVIPRRSTLSLPTPSRHLCSSPSVICDVVNEDVPESPGGALSTRCWAARRSSADVFW